MILDLQAIFNEILQDAGISNTQVEEVYSLDDEALEMLKYVGFANSSINPFTISPFHTVLFLYFP